MLMYQSIRTFNIPLGISRGYAQGVGHLTREALQRVGDLNFTWEFELMNCQVNTFLLVQLNTHGSRSMDKLKRGGEGGNVSD